MIGKFFGGALLFFAACLTIYYGVRAVASIWWILAIILFVVALLAVYIRIQKNRPKW